MSRQVITDWLLSAFRLLLFMIAALPALVLLAALVLGFMLVPAFGIGLPILAGALRATRALGDACHRLTVDVLRDEAVEVLASLGPRVYASDPTGGRRAVLGCLRDRQTWRDTLWLAIHVALTCWVALVYIPVPLLLALDPAILWIGLMWTAMAVWITPGLVEFSALAATVLSPHRGPQARRVMSTVTSRAAALPPEKMPLSGGTSA